MSCDSPANSTVPDKSLEQVMKPFDEHLTALRAELMKPHVKYNEETLLEISNLIRTSEMFLKTAQVLLTWIFLLISSSSFFFYWLFVDLPTILPGEG